MSHDQLPPSLLDVFVKTYLNQLTRKTALPVGMTLLLGSSAGLLLKDSGPGNIDSVELVLAAGFITGFVISLLGISYATKNL